MITLEFTTIIVFFISILITSIYYYRYRKTWMKHPISILFFLFFEWIRIRIKQKEKL